MLGMTGPGQVMSSQTTGPGQGPIWLDEIGCSGTEGTILECSHLPWAKHNCRHTEDVAIRCRPKMDDNVYNYLYYYRPIGRE